MARPALLRPAIPAFFLLSGATGLVYQVVWVRMLGLITGHSAVAISLVVAVFMAGLGLGAAVAGRAAPRLERPLFVYGLLEAAIGALALLTPWAFRAAAAAGLGSGPATVPLVAAILLPPTFAMGATLPLLTHWYARDAGTIGRDTGLLYAINTTGAVVGAGLAGFALLPVLGQPATLQAAAAVNLLVGGAAMLLGRRHALAPPRGDAPFDRVEPARATRRLVLVAFAISGAAAMIDQVAWTRSFELFVGSTTYAFSLIVCAFIAGLALGGHLLARRVDSSKDPVTLLAALNLGVAAASALLVPVLGELPLWLLRPIASLDGFASTQLFTAVVLFGLVLAPTVGMGGTFPVAVRALAAEPEEAPRAVGRAYGWNTAGAVLGSASAGLLVIPALGLRGALWLALAGHLLAAGLLLARTRRAALLLPGLALLGAFGTPGWDPRHMNLAPHLYADDLVRDPEALRALRDDGIVLFHQEGTGATVTVLQRPEGARVMRINGKTDASTEADRLTQSLLGALPPLLVEEPRSMFVLGLGSGMSLATALDHPLERVDVVELLDEVLAGAEWFGPPLGEPLRDPRVRVRLGDGRHLLRRGDARYDVVMTQPTNLFVSGIASLFTVEAFEEMRAALTEDGAALVWLHAYLLPEADFRALCRTFQAAFPDAALWNLGPFDYALTGTASGRGWAPSAPALERRVQALAGSRTARWAGLREAADLQRHYLLGPEALAAFAGPGRAQRDRDPFLEFSAPKGLYGGVPVVKTEDLLARREPLPLVDAGPALRERLEARRKGLLRLERALLSSEDTALPALAAVDPQHPFLAERRARLLHAEALRLARAGDFQGAAAAAEQVVVLQPEALVGRRLLAAVRSAQHRPEDALAALRDGVEASPWNAYAHAALAEALAAAGRSEEAAASRARAAELGLTGP